MHVFFSDCAGVPYIPRCSCCRTHGHPVACRSLSHHRSTRKREAERHRLDGVHRGGKHRRIGGWGGELAAWKREVLDMVEATRAE